MDSSLHRDDRSSTELLVQGIVHAWNRGDVDEFVGFLAEDVHWDDPAMPEPAEGRGAVAGFARSMFEAFSPLTYSVDGAVCVSEDGSRCAVPWRMQGTNTGWLRPPGFGPTFRAIDVRGVDVLEIRNGLVQRIATHFDTVRAAEQLLGWRIKPPVGSARERAAVVLQRGLAWFIRRGR